MPLAMFGALFRAGPLTSRSQGSGLQRQPFRGGDRQPGTSVRDSGANQNEWKGKDKFNGKGKGMCKGKGEDYGKGEGKGTLSATRGSGDESGQRLSKRQRKSKFRGEAEETLSAAKQQSEPAGQETRVGTGHKARVLSMPAGTAALGKAASRLKGSRFRWLNDTLYHQTGKAAKNLFDQDPSLADVYHEGYREQRAKWPCDPLDDIVAWMRAEVPDTAVVGDFGCGEARLAAAFPNRTVHSFDLVAVNERVTACNIAAVPLEDDSLDVAVFCLSLMGTDWLEFLVEARRCLRSDGILHIAEVESRFADVNSVVANIESVGFKQLSNRQVHNFFVEMRFSCSRTVHNTTQKGKKRRPSGTTGEATGLKGCKYRKR